MIINYQTVILKKDETLEELKNVKFNDITDLVHRLQPTYDEIIDILDLKNIRTKRTGYSLNFGIYEITNINKTLEFSLPNNVKLSITSDDIRLKSHLKKSQFSVFTDKGFFYSLLGFTRSHSYPLDDIDCGIM